MVGLVDAVVYCMQGVGAPACANILTRWFAAKERGTYWGMWNIAHNLGGFLAPVIVGEHPSTIIVLSLCGTANF
jgi:sugar phosphate permease